MKTKINLLGAILFLSLSFAAGAKAQIAAGGNYTIEKSVVAAGGGASASGNYSVEGTIGQNAAGTKQQNLTFTFQPGFWNAAPTLSPTAASVAVGGRVLTADGRGIRNVMITMTGGSGETRSVISSAFGYYRFAEIPAGETYIFNAHSKRFTFSQPTQILSIIQDTDDVNFIADN